MDIIEQLAACSELVTAIRESASFADVYDKQEFFYENLAHYWRMQWILSGFSGTLFEISLWTSRGREEKHKEIVAAAATNAGRWWRRDCRIGALLVACNSSRTTEFHSSRLDQGVRVERVGSRGSLRIGRQGNGEGETIARYILSFLSPKSFDILLNQKLSLNFTRSNTIRPHFAIFKALCKNINI